MELNLKQDRISRILFYSVLVIGVLLRCHQYFMGRSLWEDESHLALNFMKYGYADLMKPLDFIQGAPVLFLLLVKTFNNLFGYSELAFRALPFITDLLTFPLFYFVILQLTKNRIIALMGFFMFAVNITLIYFSSELKPYAVDVSMFILMTFLAITGHPYVTRKRTLLLAIAGCIALLISLSAFIVLFCIACYMLLSWYKNKRINNSDLKVLLPWAIVFLFNYFLFIHNHPSTLQQRLNYAFYFCPTSLLSCEFVTFLNKTINDVFFDLTLRISTDYHFKYILLVILVVAVGHLIKKRNSTVLLFTCLPILLHLILSAFKIYPFVYRLILYQAPALIILISLGTYLIAEFIAKKIHLFAGIAIGVFCYSFLVKPSLRDYPLWYREIKPALSFINDSIPSSEHLYVFDPINAYTYYQKRGIAKKPVYQAMEWEMTPAYFYDIVSGETNNFLLLYSSEIQFGYSNVIKDLENKKLIVRKFSYKGYDISEVKPVNDGRLIKTIDHTFFDKKFLFAEQNAIALWSDGRITSSPVPLSSGKYNLSVLAQGTPAGGVFPHLNVFVNARNIGSFFTTDYYKRTEFDFELSSDTSVTLGAEMDNDLILNKEDRNAFIRSFRIQRME